jgi:heme a synthase
MTRTAAYQPWLHRFAVLTSCVTFFLVIAGGLVTSTDSGLAVPDWPLSYGQLMPPMVGGIFYEHGHRMVATFVGFLTTILTVWIWRSDARRWMRLLAFSAITAVITQGVLGGLTVLYLLPTPVSVAHATLAQTFFSLTVLIALFTSRTWMEREQAGGERSIRLTALLTIGAIYIQLILGAWMRHSAAGMAIPDFPLSYGGIVPPGGEEGVGVMNSLRLQFYDLPPVTSSQVWIHYAHRSWALVTGCLVFWFGLRILRSRTFDRRLREPAIVMLCLVLVQILLGALTVWTGKGVQVATAHVATGALLLATSIVLTVRVYSLYGGAAGSTTESGPA